VQLENGFKLDINSLARRGFIRPGIATRPVGIRWTNHYFDTTTEGIITADLSRPHEGWLRIQIDQLDQRIRLVALSRHFGGRQWFFMCPRMNRLAMVLWLPLGARRFACRQHWGAQVAYASQFMTPDGRAHRGQVKINSRLCALGGFDPEDWDLPPKPKWMRWKTYRRAEDKFDRYEAIRDEQLNRVVGRLLLKYRHG
jgi:hypothetical protein